MNKQKIKNNIIEFIAGRFNKTLIPLEAGKTDLILSARKEVDLCLNFNEAETLYLVSSSIIAEGDFAEIGSYKGGSSKIICEAKGQRHFHLFDTWEGHPQPKAIDGKKYYKGKCLASLEKTKEYLSQYPNLHFHKGLFPESAEEVKDKKFAFVFLDGDLYQTTKDSLEFFYPRLSQGGVILIYDYPRLAGVQKAVDEFKTAKPIRIHSECAIIVKTN